MGLRSRVTLAAAFGMATAAAVATSARAADMPPQVRQHVRQADRYCRGLGGRVRTDAEFAKVLDLDGDGGEDWILDFSKFHCLHSIPPEPYCGSGGCALMIFLWQQHAEWARVFDDSVQSYRLVRSNGRLRLRVLLAGSACGKTDSQPCPEEYRFVGKKLLRVGGAHR